MKALVVDPSRAYRRLLCSVLAANDFQTEEVDSASAALQRCEGETYQIICMSLVLTDGQSSDLIAHLRTSDKNHRTTILLLTSQYTRAAVEHAYAIGVTEVFRKEDFVHFENYLRGFSEQLCESLTVKGHILYVEDHRSVAMATCKILTAAGHSVQHTVSVEAAIAALDHSDFDLVLTDVLLEGDLSGTALVRAIRHHENLLKRRLPILVISAFGDSARRIELYRSGINDYVQKPVLEEELLARMSTLMSTQKLLRQLDSQHREMQSLALIDQLTGLYNRHFLLAAAAKRIAFARRKNTALSLLVIDVDHFKMINDCHGHTAGDAVLVAIGQLLREHSRMEDIVSRYGGEEFVCLLDECSLKQAAAKAEQLRRELADLRPADLAFTASVGATSLCTNDEGFADLFQRADNAVYQAKASGRNRVVAIE